MARLTGQYKTNSEAQIAIDDLERAGIPRSAIRMEPVEGSRIGLSVSPDADHAATAFRIMKIHGIVTEATDQVMEGPPFPTENRDTSREPLEDRDDVKSITAAIARDRARFPVGPK